MIETCAIKIKRIYTEAKNEDRTKSKNVVLSSIIHHRQNPLELNYRLSPQLATQALDSYITAILSR
jgi:hypothetical protein